MEWIAQNQKSNEGKIASTCNDLLAQSNASMCVEHCLCPQACLIDPHASCFLIKGLRSWLLCAPRQEKLEITSRTIHESQSPKPIM